MSRAFSLLFLKIRSLPAKFDSLRAFLDIAGLRCPVYGFAETWLKPDNMELYNLDGYHSINSVRQDRIGGGVSLQIYNTIKFMKMPELSSNNDHIESVFAELTSIPDTPAKPIVGVTYRPPNSSHNSFFEELENIINYLSRTNRPCYNG